MKNISKCILKTNLDGDVAGRPCLRPRTEFWLITQMWKFWIPPGSVCISSYGQLNATGNKPGVILTPARHYGEDSKSGACIKWRETHGWHLRLKGKIEAHEKLTGREHRARRIWSGIKTIEKLSCSRRSITNVYVDRQLPGDWTRRRMPKLGPHNRLSRTGWGWGTPEGRIDPNPLVSLPQQPQGQKKI